MTADWRTVQRVLLPPAGRPETLPLYARIDGAAAGWTREGVDVPPGRTVSFGTYLGGVPAATWRACTDVRALRLALAIEGAATVRVIATDAEGTARTIQELAGASGEVAVEVALDPSIGWLWFEAEAGAEGARVRDARWDAPAPARDEASLAIAITTFDRVDDCARLVAALGDDERLRPRIRRVTVVDQGTDSVAASPEFARAADAWGERLAVIEQANLGGSGGFSRGMLEGTDSGASHVLLLDDDVVLEPESVLRMLAFAEHAAGLPLVGAQMLSLPEPTVLHSYGERVDLQRFWWVPVAPSLERADLAHAHPDGTPAFDRHYAVDFNGWWMCLVPTEVVRRLGAAMPFFLKWDDAEYGLRAAAAGHPTVTLPGAALWHVPWTAKDDGLDWQAYYQLRNRVVTALLHSPHRRGGRLLADTLAQDLNHLLCLQYGSAAVRHLALRDVLSGPEHLHRTLAHRRADAREVLARLGQDVRPDAALPSAASTTAPSRPHGAAAALRRLAASGLRQVRRAPGPDAEVDVRLDREAGKWWALGTVDSAVVGSATGSGGFVLRRDRRVAATLARDAIGLRVRLWWRWPRLASAYRRAAPELSGRAAWERTYRGVS